MKKKIVVEYELEIPKGYEATDEQFNEWLEDSIGTYGLVGVRMLQTNNPLRFADIGEGIVGVQTKVV